MMVRCHSTNVFLSMSISRVPIVKYTARMLIGCCLLGVALAQEAPLSDGDDDVVVINVPESSNTATLGYAQENNDLGNKSRYEIGLIRNHYVGRTFIQPGHANPGASTK